MARPEGIHGQMADLYDVFVDWSGRLGREMPGLTKRMRDADVRRVLDVGCGTGRHVAALLEAGFDAHGADVSEDMLRQARGLLGGDERLHRWRLGNPPPSELAESGAFDAVTCLGNVWPSLLSDDEVAGTLEAVRRILRPGGLFVIGLKAFAIRRDARNPYLPLLERERDGLSLFFVRFVDFEVLPLPGGEPICELHVVLARGDARSAEETEPDAPLHRVGRMRVWDPAGLERAVAAAGFTAVRASGRIDDPDAPPTTEDVFVHATAPDEAP